MKGYERLKTGNFNALDQVEQADGTVVITLHKHGENKKYRLHIKDLYGKNEKVLSDEEIEIH